MPFVYNESPEERINRVWDLEDCKNIAHKRAFYEANDEWERELSELWVSEPENMKTASFGRNWGYYVGMDEIKKYFASCAQHDRLGYSYMHPLTTWCGEVAKDRKTSQHLWYAISEETKSFGGKLDPWWTAEKIGIDFIMEEDGWKIWHLFIGTDYVNAPGDDYEDRDVDDPADYIDPVKAAFGEPTLPMTAYINRYNYYDYPTMPTPYDTFADTVSDGPEGNPMFNKEG